MGETATKTKRQTEKQRERKRERWKKERARGSEKHYLQQQEIVEHLEELARGLMDGAQHRLAAVRHRPRRLIMSSFRAGE